MVEVTTTDQASPTPEIVQDMNTGYWYIPGRDRAEVWYVDDPAELLIEDVWMRPVPPPPVDEREDCMPVVRRDKRGRFERVWWWEVCNEGTAGAVPYMEVRYPPS